MSLYIASLNSGSNGNCYYIGNEQDAVLVDTGISCRETEQRMARLGLSMQRVRAIFISHEHSDHIKGLCTIARKYGLPVYISDGTLQACGFAVPPAQIHSLSTCREYTLGQMTITSFSKYHDAAEPHSFIVSQDGVHVGVFTDIGRVCEQTIRHFSKCHAAFLEANYDEEMLTNGRYPYFLKNRIRGGHGHLSNAQALELFVKYRSPGLSHLLLSHLSRDNNDPELAAALFRQHSQGTEILVASRYAESPVIKVSVRNVFDLSANRASFD